MDEQLYYIYILANDDHSILYTGITNNLPRRVAQHKSGRGSKFTRWKKTTRLVYYETAADRPTALQREAKIKSGQRKTKILLIESINSSWNDLSLKFSN
jgi:putative endonuclease